MQLGFVGLGRMGQAMVPRLLAAGYPVMVWNRTPQRAEPLLHQGATWAGSLAELASRCNVVLSMVTDDAAVQALFAAEQGGLLAGTVQDTLFIEMSTIRPDTITRLAPQVAAQGAALVDAPMSGTVAPARAGQLLALVGGAAADVERARPLLAVLTRRIEHLGPVGSGAMMKLVLNYTMAVSMQALSEALTMGTRFGLEPQQMMDTILDSPARIGYLAMKAPAILGQADEAGFDITGVRKDLLAMVTTGYLLQVPMPTGSAALASFAAATGAGWGDQDFARMYDYYLEMVQRTQGE